MTRAYGPVTYSPRSAASAPSPSAPPVPAVRHVAPMPTGQWVPATTICRLSISGTGTLRVDGRSRAGVVTQGLAQGRYTAASGLVDVVYADTAVEIRAVITGALTVEVLA